MNIKLLAIDTSTSVCSAALYINGVVTERYHYAPRLHGELILTMIDELLQSAQIQLKDLDAFAYGCGPGSFTGVRMASSVIQGLAVGVNKPVIAISSLQAMAHYLYLQLGFTHIACAFDARMQEVYWGAYSLQGEEWHCLGQEDHFAPDKAPLLTEKGWIGAGDGWQTYKVQLHASTTIKVSYPRCYPHAVGIAYLSAPKYLKKEYFEPNHALPVYLRDKVAS